MADTLLLPAWSALPLGQDGRFTREWYSYLTNLELRATGEVADLSALTARVAALEAGGFNATISGVASVNVTGELSDGSVSITLVGDRATPSPWNVYATNAVGTKGWRQMTEALPPTFIAAGESYTVPEYRQALFALPIDVEGSLVVDGALVEV